MRVEQLCPSPFSEIANLIKNVDAEEIIWLQEEHKNQGAYSWVAPRIQNVIDAVLPEKRLKVKYIGRETATGAATGMFKKHLQQQREFIGELFN